MFQKILIANRGEIAVRIIRACREMGIKTVAVYSQADKEALHTQLADESICIGQATSADSYLNMERIISATIASKAEAIHPGYGFLSENTKFVKMCEKCNIVFIGPSSEMIARIGNKSEARKTMEEAGIPIVLGTKEAVYEVEEAKKNGRRNWISYYDKSGFWWWWKRYEDCGERGRLYLKFSNRSKRSRKRIWR